MKVRKLLMVIVIVIVIVIGVSVAIVGLKQESKPPSAIETAYRNYVKAIELSDYKSYQRAVLDPIPEAEFTVRCDLRRKSGFAEINEGLGTILLYGGANESDAESATSTGLSPWRRANSDLRFKKVGDSWKVVDNLK